MNLWNSSWKDGEPLTIRMEIHAPFGTGSYTDMEPPSSRRGPARPERYGRCGVPVPSTPNEKKGTMDNSLMLAFLVIDSMEHDARSALPDAPPAAARRAGSIPRGRVRLQGWLARVLHHAARAIEPDSPVVADPRPRGPAAVETTSA